jgi:hypothetical protein
MELVANNASEKKCRWKSEIHFFSNGDDESYFLIQ